MTRQKTFCGYPLDNSHLLMAYVHLAPTRDVAAGEMYSIGKDGFGFADNAVKAGETAAFIVGGNLVMDCAEGVTFHEGERAAYDAKRRVLVKGGTPGAYEFFEIELFSPCDDSDHRPFAIVFFDQPVRK